MEKTSRRGFLGRHRSCDSGGIDILSDSIECNHPSSNTSSLLYSKSCWTEHWRSLIRKKSIHVTPTPPKISLRHEWTKELGSKVVQQPEGETVRQQEGEVVRQTKFFQSTQPTPNPIRDRSGRPDNMKDGGNTSRSQEINVNSFNEELSSSDRTGRLVETEVNQTRSSEDSKSLNVEQTHDRTGQPVTDTAAVQHDSQAYHEANTLNVDVEVFHKKMEKSIVVHDENHEPTMVNEADMDFLAQAISCSNFALLVRARSGRVIFF